MGKNDYQEIKYRKPGFGQRIMALLLITVLVGSALISAVALLFN